MPRRPLHGIRVVDLTIERGELTGRLLSDLGAEVLRIEPPEGSPSRTMPPLVDDVSLFFAFRNAGKRSVALDLSQDDDRERLHQLLACSDVVIDSAEPGAWADSGLDADDLAARHPHLIVCSITSYGRTGPYAGRDVPCAVLDATGGMAFKAGVASREPLLPPGTIADDTAGMHAVFAIECALFNQIATGAGQVIDLSVNEACAQIADWSLSNWTRSLDAGSPSYDGRMGPGPIYTILPCKDGYVRLVIIAPRHWRAMRAWLGEPEYLQDPELENLMGRFGISEAVLNPLYAELFAPMTMLEVAEEAQRRGIVCTPILKPDDVLVNPHFADRGSFTTIDDPTLGEMKFASGFFEIDGERVGPTGPIPSEVGSDTDAVFAELGSARPAPHAAIGSERPLAGLRVMDFGHGGVGVEAGRLLAEYGADVIKIESRTYPDFIRVVLGGEMSPSFATSSRSKRSIGVNAKSPEGVALLRRLAAVSDVVIENNSTGIMDSMGVGYGDLSAHNPNLVMMSSQLMGSRGPWASWSGYGPNTQVTGGMTHLWNYENEAAPAGSMSIFPDHFAGRTGAVVALAGVLGRRLHDDGGFHAEVCQVEQVVNVMADLMAKESLRPGSVQPRGNHNDRGTPWGLFPCSEPDSWVAICTRSDLEWQALVEMLGAPEWATTGDLSTLAHRQAREAEIDEHLAAWTRERTVGDVVEACLTHRVPAGPMLNSQGQYNDPHLRARGFIVELQQPPIGNMTFEGPAFHATAMPGPDIRPAPGLGADTLAVCAELGYSDAEVEALLAAGVIEVDTASGS
jgi:crotonobetainyl-CoA:carnitine CoA-transferase CaiB-like acyl-CoA transferase